jgi:hypothetical protein
MSTMHSTAVAKNLYGCMIDNVGANSGIVLPRFNMQCEGASGGGGGKHREASAGGVLTYQQVQKQ